VIDRRSISLLDKSLMVITRIFRRKTAPASESSAEEHPFS
jgi:hypothetical protein